MTINLKALGLVLVAAFALNAIGAQAASAADKHEFDFDGERTVLTGTGGFSLTIGTVGIDSCSATFEGTVVGAKVGDTTYQSDEITVKPTCSGTIRFNDCALVFDSDTTDGNVTGEPDKHANFKIECAFENKIEIHLWNCTLTIQEQELKHAVRYVNDGASAFEAIMTAHGTVLAKVRNTASQPVNGCLTYPTGAIGKITGTITTQCRRDDGEPPANSTTPTGTEDEKPTECSVTDI